MKHTKLIFTFLFFIFLSTNLYAQYQQWVSRYNGTGNGNDNATSIAVDGLGNVYVTGNSAGNGTGTDCVTIKYNSDGDTVWVRRYNGPANSSDEALAIGVDSLGNVYVAGNSVGSGTGWDYLAIKYNSSGVQQWIQRYNGSAGRDDKALSAAIDEMGNIHLTGYSVLSNNWITIYLTIKYNSTGVLQWARTASAAPWFFCKANSIALDNIGNVYVTGETGNDTAWGGWSDFYTIKYNSNGIVMWHKIDEAPFSFQQEDYAYSVGVDKSGYVYVSGETIAHEYPFTSYVFTITYPPGGGGHNWDWSDLLVSSFAADNLVNMYADGGGTISKIRPLYMGAIWTHHYGSSGSGNSITSDSLNNVYVTGSSGGNYITLKYNSSGNQQWVHGYNGPGNGSDNASSITFDNSGNVYVTGSSVGIGTGNDYATIKYIQQYPPPLYAFNLNTPLAGDTITSLYNSSIPVTFSWDTSATGAFYKWIFGTSLPSRLKTYQIGINSLTITLGYLDYILAEFGLYPGDHLLGAWDVWAFRSNPPQNDSMKASNGPRTVILKRGSPVLTSFSLSSPPNGTQINTSWDNDTIIHMEWTRSGIGTPYYKWKFGSPTIANPLLIFEANNSGYDSVFSIRNSSLDSALASLGVQLGEIKLGEWAVWAYNGIDSMKSTQTWSITLKRRAVFILFADSFANGTGNWTITNDGGDCVWQIFSAPYPNPYSLPSTSISPVFSADASNCGPGTNTNTTATITNNINCSVYEDVSLEFDNDWHVRYFPQYHHDSAIVEVSYNGGTNWTPIILWHWQKKESHEIVSLPGAANIPNLKIRFRTKIGEPGFNHAWWTIDNVTIKGDLLTGVTKKENQIPTKYALLQNYPNPFNPSTKIKFDIPKSSYVKLIVYDVLGREITKLVNEKLSIGSYEMNWNATGYPSGVYFYRLVTDKYVSVKKMVLLK